MNPSRSHKTELRSGEEIDHFMEGRLQLIQSKSGYRFSIDAVLLAEFVSVRKGDIVIDIGTGCGVIPLILLLTKPVGRVFGLEIQEELADQASRNAFINRFEDKMEVILGDIRNPPFAEKSADLITCNPPYRKAKNGRVNPDLRRAIARHEILASLDDVLHASKSLLRKKGRLALIYPCVRLVDILIRMRRFNLEPKKIQINHADSESNAKLVMIEASIGGKPGIEMSPPVFGQPTYLS